MTAKKKKPEQNKSTSLSLCFEHITQLKMYVSLLPKSIELTAASL